MNFLSLSCTSFFFCRQFVKVTISNLKILLPWLMEKLYGVCLIITLGGKFAVLVLAMYCSNHFVILVMLFFNHFKLFSHMFTGS